jgi:hypothetical protein
LRVEISDPQPAQILITSLISHLCYGHGSRSPSRWINFPLAGFQKRTCDTDNALRQKGILNGGEYIAGINVKKNGAYRKSIKAKQAKNYCNKDVTILM